jgi:hypothetical protein
LSIVPAPRQNGDPRNAVIYWKSEAQRRKAKIRELESQNARLLGFVRPLLVAHLKLRAETRHALDRMGLPDADTILQLAAAKSDEEFGLWFSELVALFERRES